MLTKLTSFISSNTSHVFLFSSLILCHSQYERHFTHFPPTIGEFEGRNMLVLYKNEVNDMFGPIHMPQEQVICKCLQY